MWTPDQAKVLQLTLIISSTHTIYRVFRRFKRWGPCLHSWLLFIACLWQRGLNPCRNIIWVLPWPNWDAISMFADENSVCHDLSTKLVGAIHDPSTGTHWSIFRTSTCLSKLQNMNLAHCVRDLSCPRRPVLLRFERVRMANRRTSVQFHGSAVV